MEKVFSKINTLINKIINHTPWYNAYWQGSIKFWKNIPFELDVVNLGSGAAYHAFDYSDTGVKGMNWALSPQSLVHDYNILRNYFSYLREGAVVIITICPFSCLYSQYSKQSNFKYYPILHPATIIDFDDNERTRVYLIRQNPFKSMPLYCIKMTLMDAISFIYHKIIPFRKPNLKASADAMMNGWKSQFGISDISAPLSEKHLAEQKSRRETLNNIVIFCKERNLKPVIVIPPMHKTLTNQYTDAFLANYVEAFLSGVDAPIYNYMKDTDFQSEDVYSSALFLNKHGAKLFTSKVLKLLGLKK